MKNYYASNSASAIPYRREYKICFEPFPPLPGQKVARELSTSGAVLLQQLDYWFARYPKGFYKFMEPPTTVHKAYKDGDSWAEELAFSRREFSTAFEQIGIAYKSKKQFKEAKASGDVFQGRFYCSYFDRIARVTWYYRNHANVDAWLKVVSCTALTKQETASGHREIDGEVKSVNDASAVLGSDASSVTEVTHPPFDSTEITSKDYSTEITNTSTTRAKPRKEGGGSERVPLLDSEGSNAKEIAEWLCSEYWYHQMGSAEPLRFNCTRYLVDACKGHTKATARDAMLAFWEAMLGYVDINESINKPERFLAMRLKDREPLSAGNRERVLQYEQEVKARHHRKSAADYNRRWLAHAESAGILLDVRINEADQFYSFWYGDTGEPGNLNLWDLPPRYAHLTIDRLMKVPA